MKLPTVNAASVTFNQTASVNHIQLNVCVSENKVEEKVTTIDNNRPMQDNGLNIQIRINMSGHCRAEFTSEL